MGRLQYLRRPLRSIDRRLNCAAFSTVVGELHRLPLRLCSPEEPLVHELRERKEVQLQLLVRCCVSSGKPWISAI